jgi:DNA-binding response OmpR family regulator
MKKGKFRILVVDDEPKYIYIMQLNLEARGYEVLVAGDGETAVELAASQEPDLIVLDIRMPGMDGYEACQRIRQFSTVPIIMLTAMAEEADKVKGLDLGADDYVTKPFGIDELLARVRAGLRRAELRAEAVTEPILQAGDLRIDLAQQQVFVSDQEVPLTPIEYHLLSELVKHAGRVVVSERLLEAVWGSGYEGADRTLRQAIYRLRRKIEPDPKNPQYIQTRSGLGYVFILPDQEGWAGS